MSFERIRHRRVGVYGVFRDADGRTLVTAVPDRSGEPRWSLPGGVLGHGESPEAVLSRGAFGVFPGPVPVSRLRDAVTDVIEPVGSRAMVHTVRLLHHAEVGSWADLPRDPGPGYELVPETELAELPLLDFAASALGLPSTGFVEDAIPETAPSPGDGPARVQRTASYAVLIADRRILLTRLSGSGRWTLPGGGIEFGEQPVAAVRREMMEETGLPLHREQLMGSGDMHSTYRSPTGRLEDFHAVRLYFRGEVPLDVEPVVQEIGGSTDAVAWIPVRELDGLSLTTAVREGMGIVHPEFTSSGPGPDRPG